MTASEMWCFLRNLPLLIGGLIPRKQPHWRLLLMLIDIIDIVFAPAITENLSHFLLFPEKQLLPKHHFLMHYARCLRNSGPPVIYWSMRFESRHQTFKDLAKTTNCFKNICKTLVKLLVLQLTCVRMTHCLVSAGYYSFKPTSVAAHSLTDGGH